MPDRHGKLTDHFCRSLVLDKSETDLDYCQPIASRRVTEEVSKNARRAAVLAQAGRLSALLLIRAYLAVLLDVPECSWRPVEARRGVRGLGDRPLHRPEENSIGMKAVLPQRGCAGQPGIL